MLFPAMTVDLCSESVRTVSMAITRACSKTCTARCSWTLYCSLFVDAVPLAVRVRVSLDALVDV